MADTMDALPGCMQNAQKRCLSAGTQIFEPGDPCENFIYLTSGLVRVDLNARSGRDVMLYEFGAGESCVMTSACLLSGASYTAHAHVVEEATGLALSKAAFEASLNEDAEFRKLVFDGFAHRLGMMMARLEELTCSSIDARLANRLLVLSARASPITITHEKLAQDLGTAREVISRKLAIWEKDGTIRRNRGTISLIDEAALLRLAHA